MTVWSLPKTSLRWAASHGISRALAPRELRRGNPVVRLSHDPAMREDPAPAFDQIRAAGPLSGGEMITATVTHAVASEVLRSERFGSAASSLGLPGPLRAILTRTAEEDALGPIDPPSLLALDPPDHTRLRKLMSRSFTARRVAALEGDVRALTDRLLDEMAGLDRVDLVEAFAARLPVAVIADLLGVPPQERGQLLEWGNQGALQLDNGLGFGEFHRSVAAVREMHHWFEDHVARLRRSPGDDLLSRLILDTAGLPADQRPSDLELRMVGLLVLGAGFETTVNLIGNAVVLLDRHRAQLERLRAEPDGWTNAVEEVLRFDSPVQFTARRARQPVTVADRHLPAGHTVIIVVGGVNRDPEVFADPHRFDVTRHNAAEHLAFSAGAHFCLGSGLARLEARLALTRLFERFGDLRVEGDPVRRTTRVLRGFERLPVRLS